LGVVAALFLLSPEACLRWVSALGIGAAALASAAGSRTGPRLSTGALMAAAVILPVSIPHAWIALRPSDYKGLSRALRIPGTEVIGEHSSPLGLLTVVRSPMIPFRHAPGLSLNSPVEPPPQLGVFIDGDALTVITRYDGRHEPLAYLDFTTGALPYHLLRRPSVLILGAGGGAEVLQALDHGAERIDAVELNPQLARLVAREHRDFAGGLYGLSEVRVHVAEARGFVTRHDARWDLIQIPLLDSLAASTAGVHSLSESYLYTVEAFRAYRRHLTPGGLLAITRWLKLPPRDSLKLFATALLALERDGTRDPARRLALIRGWNTTTLLVKNGPVTADDIVKIRAFAEERSFDLAYVPDLAPEDANRFNVLAEADFFAGARALAGPSRADFIARYKFDLTPATDDRPYFFDFFTWRSLPELLELRAQGGAALLEWGYLILVATLVQAALFSIVLILVPLWLHRRRRSRHPDRGRIVAYFLALGLAFLFIEIAFIQRFILFLNHPLYAVAVVLASFLVFAGLGSGTAPCLARYLDERRSAARGVLSRFSAIDVAILGITAVALTYLGLLPVLFDRLMAWPDTARVALSVVFIAPLAFCMGMPFPLGLSRVSARMPALVPWAWGVNGCASVASAVLATILAIHVGFTAVVMLALLLYLFAAALFRQRRPHVGAPASHA